MEVLQDNQPDTFTLRGREGFYEPGEETKRQVEESEASRGPEREAPNWRKGREKSVESQGIPCT